jgi:hypothetical protein
MKTLELKSKLIFFIISSITFLIVTVIALNEVKTWVQLPEGFADLNVENQFGACNTIDGKYSITCAVVSKRFDKKLSDDINKIAVSARKINCSLMFNDQSLEDQCVKIAESKMAD